MLTQPNAAYVNNNSLFNLSCLVLNEFKSFDQDSIRFNLLKFSFFKIILVWFDLI